MITFKNELSGREKEVLKLVAKNYSNTEIAKTLYISVSTVKSHISTIFEKLNANGRVHASVIALSNGIISLE